MAKGEGGGELELTQSYSAWVQFSSTPCSSSTCPGASRRHGQGQSRVAFAPAPATTSAAGLGRWARRRRGSHLHRQVLRLVGQRQAVELLVQRVGHRARHVQLELEGGALQVLPPDGWLAVALGLRGQWEGLISDGRGTGGSGREGGQTWHRPPEPSSWRQSARARGVGWAKIPAPLRVSEGGAEGQPLDAAAPRAASCRRGHAPMVSHAMSEDSAQMRKRSVAFTCAQLAPARRRLPSALLRSTK